MACRPAKKGVKVLKTVKIKINSKALGRPCRLEGLLLARNELDTAIDPRDLKRLAWLDGDNLGLMLAVN
jgi:hypothetical protein